MHAVVTLALQVARGDARLVMRENGLALSRPAATVAA